MLCEVKTYYTWERLFSKMVLVKGKDKVRINNEIRVSRKRVTVSLKNKV